MGKTRLDALLVERGLIDSREKAKAVIMGGKVYVSGGKAVKPGMQVADDIGLEVRQMPAYVSRGGKKLEKALMHFGVNPTGKVCIDCGASTGGFTDCLLQNGAVLVYALDVGYGQLAWALRTDRRVVAMERTNIRHARSEMFGERPELAVIDLSFISLRLVLGTVRGLLAGDAQALCLIKPQFEAGRGKVGKKGVVRDPGTHKAVLDSFVLYARHAGFYTRGLTYSPIRGPEGNIEYLGWLSGQKGSVCEGIDTEALVKESHGAG